MVEITRAERLASVVGTLRLQGRQVLSYLVDAVREIKAALRARINASGRTVDEVFAVMERRVRAQVDG